MKYLIINPETYKVVVKQYGSPRFYSTKAGAKRSLAVITKKTANKKAEYTLRNGENGFDNQTGKELEILRKAIVIDEKSFKDKEPLVIKKDFMTGETFIEPLNTPYYASRSSESYWSS